MAQEVNQLGRVTPDLYTYTASGSAPMEITILPVERFRPIHFTLHTADPVTDSVTITLDSVQGATYDTIRLSYDGGFDHDLLYTFDRDEFYSKGNALIFAFNNTGATDWNMTFTYEIL